MWPKLSCCVTGEWRVKLTSVFRSLCNSGNIKTKNTSSVPQVALIWGKHFRNPKSRAESAFKNVVYICEIELFQPFPSLIWNVHNNCVTLGNCTDKKFVVIGSEWAAVTASLSYTLIPLSLTPELLCIAALNVSSAAAAAAAAGPGRKG